MQTFSFTSEWWQFLLLAIASYCVGCVNIARLIARKKHTDVSKIGSGNPGTLNMSREFGWKVGLLTFSFDALKGGVMALIAHLIYKDYVFDGTIVRVSDVARYLCGLCAVLGHVFPAVYRFKGGKGIATALGVFWVALSCDSLWYILIGVGLALVILFFILITELGSLVNIVAVAAVSLIQIITYVIRYENVALNGYLIAAYVLLFAFSLVTWWAHRKNVLRLFAGEEHHTSLKKIIKKKS